MRISSYLAADFKTSSIMKKVLIAAVLMGGMLAGCTNSNKQTTDNDMKQELQLAQEWDKVFPPSEKVNHRKVTFETQYGLTLAADLYTPKAAEEKAGKGQPKNMIPWDKLAAFFAQYLR